MSTERGQGVVRAIVALAQTHGLDVVAEGVETPDQLTALIAMGVTRVQGNFLGRAAPGSRSADRDPRTGHARWSRRRARSARCPTQGPREASLAAIQRTV